MRAAAAVATMGATQNGSATTRSSAETTIQAATNQRPVAKTRLITA